MDIIVKNYVTMLIKVTTQKNIRRWNGIWIIFQFVVSLLMKDSALLPHIGKNSMTNLQWLQGESLHYHNIPFHLLEQH